MALIWADGFAGDKALAPAWCDLVLAEARLARANVDKDGEEFLAASKAKKHAQAKYDQLVIDATQALKALLQKGENRTHVLIVGVGKYNSAEIVPSVTTSIHGARAFAEWTLTEFSKSDRPLGSVEFLSSPAPGQGEWTPSAAAAARLGFAAPTEVPGEPAMFDNIQRAFDRWLKRCATCPDNAAIWYFSGHGVFKSGALLLPQDVQLPSKTESAKNLIDPTMTQAYMQNHQPSVQCFFIDACSEETLSTIYNQRQHIGVPLHTPSSGSSIAKRDGIVYFGSKAGGKAFGPEKEAPFFTQELLLCLKQRGGDARFGGKRVTTASLSTALKAAASHRAEIENNPGIDFTDTKPGVSAGDPAELCDLPGPAEVLVQVSCMPKAAMATAKFYVVAPSGERVSRTAPRDKFWCTPVRKGDWTASADFDPPTDFKGMPEPFQPIPPVFNVELKAK